ncbi:L-rhamnose mutarotase [Kribbella speibonae]|uniref:L-rhamnose mutarotase n=1 Tax=Kribbella speibonae TaxID=1572660 RepID=A0A4R0J462_9ACTN|nr:L-rhamnose mutarotase [Kribbella speibonae]TCC16124.1 L-rhamnose mutarotase [Kribbella speibonae]TCC40260.1 L-rhamnose mutarotase [Kribbella speibonae]
MNRYCFCLQVRPDRLDEYVERHRDVWPDMQAALRDSGWHNYSLFLRDDGLLIGYVESADLEAAQKAMAATDVNTRWQAQMTEFFTGIDGRPPDESFLLLPEIFHLKEDPQ